MDRLIATNTRKLKPGEGIDPSDKGKITIDMGYRRIDLDSKEHESLMTLLESFIDVFGTIHLKHVVWQGNINQV